MQLVEFRVKHAVGGAQDTCEGVKRRDDDRIRDVQGVGDVAELLDHPGTAGIGHEVQRSFPEEMVHQEIAFFECLGQQAFASGIEIDVFAEVFSRTPRVCFWWVASRQRGLRPSG